MAAPSLCSLSFVFLEDRAFIFLPGGLGRVGALGAWHCARDPGQAGEASNLAESSQGPAPHPIFRALAPSSNPTFGRMT